MADFAQVFEEYVTLHNGTAAGISATLVDLPTFPKLS